MASLKQILRKPRSIRFRGERGKNRSTIRSVLFLPLYLPFIVCLFASIAHGMQLGTRSIRIEGTVFVQDAKGNRSSVAGATVKLDGAAALETETDGNGEYVFAAVSPGAYEVTASAPGLEVRRTLQVGDGDIRLSLELKPVEITSTVVVKDEGADRRDSAPSEIISETTLRNAPNVNERFESSLPLIPGVVRGPDGHIKSQGHSEHAEWRSGQQRERHRPRNWQSSDQSSYRRSGLGASHLESI